MQGASKLARLQQATTAGVAVLSVSWLAWHWHAAPVRAVLGALVIWFSYGIVLAWQCWLVARVGRDDPAPRPKAGELARAWWGELWAVQRVFFWRQPFRWDAIADAPGAGSGRRGIVFVHGFVCNRGFWTPWLRRVSACGRAFVAVNLEPVFGSIDAYATIIDRAVREVTQATGLPPVLVCHSMGGVAARAWLRQARDPARVHRVITIASPHGGTWLGRFSHFANGRQMRLGSAWLEQLARDEAGQARPPFTCWYSHCDNIVFPASTATLPWADNRLVPGPAHVELAFDARVMQESLALALG